MMHVNLVMLAQLWMLGVVTPVMAQTTYRGNARVDLGLGSYGDQSGNSSIGMTYPGFQTEIKITPNESQTVTAISPHFQPGVCNYLLGNEQKTSDWSKYVQGATAVAGLNGLALRGFTAEFGSSVPYGIGMSSSAALLKALWEGMNDIHRWNLTDLELVALAKQTENSPIVGAKTGDYDHAILKLAPPGKAVRINFGGPQLSYENADWFPNARIGLIHSGFEHKLAEDSHLTIHPWETNRSYNQRVRDLDLGAERLGFSSRAELRFLTEAQLRTYRQRYGSNDPVYLRLLHAYKEARLTEIGFAAIQNNDLPTYLSAVNQSQRSARRNLQNTTPATELLVTVGHRVARELGLRNFAMKAVGGGDGGAVLVITDDQIPADLYERILTRYVAERSRLWSGVEPDLDRLHPAKVIFPR